MSRIMHRSANTIVHWHWWRTANPEGVRTRG